VNAFEVILVMLESNEYNSESGNEHSSTKQDISCSVDCGLFKKWALIIPM